MITKLNYKLGFSLVEVTLALGVSAISLLAILALIPTGLTQMQTSLEETAAVNVARSILVDLGNTPVSNPKADTNSPRFGITVPAATQATHTFFFSANGQVNGAQDTDAVASQNPRYRATITLTPPTTTSWKLATTVRVLISWPALADPTASTIPPTKYTGSYECITALDRADMRYGN